MFFKAKKKVNVRTPSRDFLMLNEGDEVELPSLYVNHPDLEVIEKKIEVKLVEAKKKVAKKK